MLQSCTNKIRFLLTLTVSQAAQAPLQNRLLAALPAEEYDRLLPYFKPLVPAIKETLYEPNEPIQHVYFINSGVASMLTVMEDGSAIEVGTIGNEGMVGIPVLLGADRIPGQAFMQIPGSVLRMATEDFKRQVTPGTPLHNLLQRYLQALFNQVAQSAACNRLHSLEERFCRWLLMTRDRVPTDEFPMTQEFLSLMLGVHRPSVSEVAGTFQRAGIIRYSRGKITILDRSGLEMAACECYEVVKREFDHLLGGKGQESR